MDEHIAKRHKARRMFAIVNNKICLGPENSTLSHYQWFEQEGFTNVNAIVRGSVKENKILFYVDDFKVTKEAEDIFFKHLPKLTKKFNLTTHLILGGKVKGNVEDGDWEPIINYETAKALYSKTN